MLAVQKKSTENPSIFRHAAKLMGDHFEISVVANDAFWANQRIECAINEINRIDKLLSTFGDESIINEINRNAGIQPVKVSPEVYYLIDRSLQISELTYGTFDISYYTNGGNSNVTCAGYKNVVLDAKKTTVFLTEKGMRIGFGANSRGYAADRAKYILQLEGVANGVINAGGDLLTWGLQPNLEPWTIAAADETQSFQPYANLVISNMAFATSVNTERYASLSKKNNSSTLATGFVVSDIKSVSIVSPRAEFADAMASPILSIGINNGLYLINQLNQVGCIVVDDHSRVYTSKDIRLVN